MTDQTHIKHVGNFQEETTDPFYTIRTIRTDGERIVDEIYVLGDELEELFGGEFPRRRDRKDADYIVRVYGYNPDRHLLSIDFTEFHCGKDQDEKRTNRVYETVSRNGCPKCGCVNFFRDAKAEIAYRIRTDRSGVIKAVPTETKIKTDEDGDTIYIECDECGHEVQVPTMADKIHQHGCPDCGSHEFYQENESYAIFHLETTPATGKPGLYFKRDEFPDANEPIKCRQCDREFTEAEVVG